MQRLLPLAVIVLLLAPHASCSGGAVSLLGALRQGYERLPLGFVEGMQYFVFLFYYLS